MNYRMERQKSRKLQVFTMIGLFFLMGLIMNAAMRDAHAAGKKKADAATAPSCPIANPTSFPARPIVVLPVIAKPFPLTPTKTADLSTELTGMMNTVVTQTGVLFPTTYPQENLDNPCESHLEMETVVTGLEMNLTEIGLWVGYTPSGSHNAITEITGETNVNIGNFSIDFQIKTCKRGVCSKVLAASANHSLVGSQTSFKVNFGVISAGPSFATNPAFSKIARTIMTDGLNQLIRAPLFGSLTWTATVQEYDAATGSLIFDAGQQSRLALNQKFVVYAPAASTGTCTIYRALAYVHTTRVDPVSSVAWVDQVLDSRGIRPGDIVMVNNP